MLLFIRLILCVKKRASCFNTSHVVIYLIWAFYFDTVHQFQYISCCYLSEKFSLNSKLSQSFNTSHVVIYRIGALWWKLKIQCFNTSHVVIYLIHIVKQFWYPWSFNTSHVVIYRFLRAGRAYQLFPCFNTSHVVIYPACPLLGCSLLTVSIHLMLLFIQVWKRNR